MSNPFTWLKNRLSHVSANSWHYQLTKAVWGYKTEGHACTYYWLKLPSSLLLVALAFILVAFMTVLYVFFGFVPTLFPTSNEEMRRYHDRDELGGNYPYKTLPNGRKVPVAPWEVVAVAGVLYALYYLVFLDPTLGLNLLLISLIVIGLSLVGYAIFRLWTGTKGEEARAGLGRMVDQVCPPLIVEDEEENDGKE